MVSDDIKAILSKVLELEQENARLKEQTESSTLQKIIGILAEMDASWGHKIDVLPSLNARLIMAYRELEKEDD